MSGVHGCGTLGLALAMALCAAGPVRGESLFATRVLVYEPAPGQFVNDPLFNNPNAALGPPVGGGTAAANNGSVVTLGGFGGTIVLGFDRTVRDHPLNPMGLDAIVFGNAFRPGGTLGMHWAECATIEISLDVNGNGLADDPWYLIPGSHIVNPAAVLRVKTWDDNVLDDTHPPHAAEWIPAGRGGQWTTQAYELVDALFAEPVVRSPGTFPASGLYGYADFSPTLILGDLTGNNVVDDFGIAPEAFYTVPSDPFRQDISAGSGGGDAFDIAWAIDPVTGEPAGLPGFDFIRLTTAVDAVHFVLGEKSAEIDAVAMVVFDPFGDANGDEVIDLLDVAWLQHCFLMEVKEAEACGVMDRDGDGLVDWFDAAAFVGRMTGPIEEEAVRGGGGR